MLEADTLVRVAERANPRRSFLLVSRVLGKHLPVDAGRCRLAGIALGLRVAEDPRAELAQAVLRQSDAAASALLVAEIEQAPATSLPDAVVIGFAETATGLGEQVASALDAAWFQTTTRQRHELEGAVAFEESHSHAPEQWIGVPVDGWPDGPLVIVDDELTTGATAARLVEALHELQPRARYVIAALVDGRPDDDGPLEHCAEVLDVRIDVVSLQRRGAQPARSAGWSGGALPEVQYARLRVRVGRELPVGFRRALQHHGQSRDVRRALAREARETAADIGPLPPGSLVLGTGEHLSFAQHFAQEARALTSSTTRSPVLVARGPGYPIRDGLAFESPDVAGLTGYAYNVHAADRAAIVVHFQDTMHRLRGQRFLETLIQAGAPSVTVITLAN
jgi:adenine/guanine phosphoribosyltransferase-like PRPP-binding protein